MEKHFVGILIFMAVNVCSLYAQDEVKLNNSNDKRTNMDIHIVKVDVAFKTMTVVDEKDALVSVVATNLGSVYELMVNKAILIQNEGVAEHNILKNPYIALNSEKITINMLKTLDGSKVSDIEFIEDKDAAVQRFGKQAKNGAISITTL